MSTPTTTPSVDDQPHSRAVRLLALGGVVLLLGSSITTLQTVTKTVGGTQTLFTTVVLLLAMATLLARTIRPALAAVLALAAGALGFGYYLTVTGVGVRAVFVTTDTFVSDTIALATGLPILGIVEASIWTLAFVPGPVFLTWYLALRRRYVLSVIPGGGALLFLVLTGDATGTTVLAGTLGAVTAVGFGELESRGGTLAQADVLAILVAVVIVLSSTVALVPTGASGPDIFGTGDQEQTLEGSLNAAPDRSTIQGQIELSPEVRFTVRSRAASRWRVGTYDRFTGDGWVRTGDDRAYDGPLPEPPGERMRLRQTVMVKDRLDVMPTAPQPVDIDGDARANTRATVHGQFRPDRPLIEGDVYNVESEVLTADPETLRAAGTDYPDWVEDRYLQTPEDTSAAFEQYTSDLVADEDTPYDKAAVIENDLQTSKDYSLDIDRPDGNVAEAFLLEMEAGYCVYFATTMVQMLRTEGVPARYVVGYTSGQQVGDNEWVVRGLNAHAWVEVYVPDQGWVTFDPTPAAPRDADRAERIANARQSNTENIDTNDSATVDVTDTPEPTETGDRENEGPTDSELGDVNASDGTPTETADNSNETGAAGHTATDGPLSLPSAENTAFGLAVLLGLVASARRSGALSRARRKGRVYWHGFRADPNTDTKRAYRRLEMLLERQYRPRRRGETPRQYLAALADNEDLDSRVRIVGDRYERAVYGGGVDRQAADTAITAVNELTRARLPVVGRRWR